MLLSSIVKGVIERSTHLSLKGFLFLHFFFFAFHANTRGCQVNLFICKNFDQMDGIQAIDICGILDIPLSSINMESYICSDRCFRSLKRFEKLQEDAKPLFRTLKENFVRNNTVKRGVPLYSAISPSVLQTENQILSRSCWLD